MDPDIPALFRDDRGGGRPYDLAVLVSGGVDSAVVLAGFVREGLNPFAVTLALPRFSGLASGGEPRFDSDEAATASAIALCRGLGVSHAVLDLRAAFRTLVVEPFAAAYRNGLTPNPCVRCNPDVKFGLARRWAEREAGTRVVATGHYAGLVESGGRIRLARVHAHDKDQSYFLYRLPPNDLADTRFPLAAYPDKDAVRRRAREWGLAASGNKDSQDICFLPGGDYRPLLAGAARPGPIVDLDGREVGRHDGGVNFTIGQRKGLKIGFGKPMYVVRIDAGRNAVVIGPREAVGGRDVAARDAVVHDPDAIRPGCRVLAKIRSGGTARPAEVIESGGGGLAVRFDEAVFAPAPGQHLVLYDGAGMVLGGGEIRL